MGNYSFKTTGLPEPVDGVVEGYNFTQGVPHTKIYEGVNGLTFRNCNLLNCDVPEDAVVEGYTMSYASFCSHLHPEWLSRGFIPECQENCTHVTRVDNVTVDGVVIDQNYTYEDKAVE